MRRHVSKRSNPGERPTKAAAIAQHMDLPMHRLLLLIIPAFALAGCTSTVPSIVPVKGQVQGIAETLQGTASGRAGGDGVLTITSSRGAVCVGNFVQTSKQSGEGVLTCDDGRSGLFRFSPGMAGGAGEGTLGGRAITLTFGE